MLGYSLKTNIRLSTKHNYNVIFLTLLYSYYEYQQQALEFSSAYKIFRNHFFHWSAMFYLDRTYSHQLYFGYDHAVKYWITYYTKKCLHEISH